MAVDVTSTSPAFRHRSSRAAGWHIGKRWPSSKLKSFEIEEKADLCGVAAETRVGGVSGELDWLLIENGSAVYMRRGCGSE